MKNKMLFNFIAGLSSLAFISVSQASNDSIFEKEEFLQEDKFDFLTNKFPKLVNQANEPFKKCGEETKHYKKLDEWKKNSGDNEQETLLKNVEKVINIKILSCFPKGEKELKHHNDEWLAPLEKNHPKHGYYNIFFSRAFKDHSFLENLLLAAEYIYQVGKDEKNGTTIFLGRTPCLIQVAFEEILKIENLNSIQQNEEETAPEYIHLNFSGHPDSLTKRESEFFSSNTNIARDMVTEEKLNHYFNYLDQKNILKSEKLRIVDIIGSGSSLNSFLRILGAYYQKKDQKLPSLSFLNLTQDVAWKTKREGLYTFQSTSNICNQGILTLPSDEEKNMKLFKINTFGIPLFELITTYVLDQDMFQEFLVHGIQYPAQRWTQENDNERLLGAKYHKPFYETLRKKFELLIQLHKKLMN